MFQTPERRPKSKFADLTGEPSFLKSAGRRFQSGVVPTPLHFKERDIMAELKRRRCKHAQCSSKTKAGTRCKNCASSDGSGVCTVHGGKAQSKKARGKRSRR